jgi:hypothetical protein
MYLQESKTDADIKGGHEHEERAKEHKELQSSIKGREYLK